MLLLKALCALVRVKVKLFKAKRAEKLYDKGYREAMAKLCSQVTSPAMLYISTESAEVLGQFTAYHKGVRSAIYDFEQSGVDESPQHVGVRV